MPTVKRIVCLANSRKLHGHCIAGKEIQGERVLGWIRPVSARVQEEVSDIERRYEDGDSPRVLDIIDVPLLDPRPKGHQQENWLLDPNHRWRRVAHLQWEQLRHFADPVGQLWINNQSTARGISDQISVAQANEITNSLRLIAVQQLVLSVFNYYNKRRVQGRFEYGGAEYWLWVTDPIYEEPYKAERDGDYGIGECWLTISLTEPFMERNACYKVIAAIIQPQPGSRS